MYCSQRVRGGIRKLLDRRPTVLSLTALVSVGFVSAGFVASAGAEPTCLRAAPLFPGCESGRLEVEFAADVTPRKLPRHEMAPVALKMHGEIGTSNGGHPSALREVDIDFLDVVIDAKGLTACGLRDLQLRRVAAARNFCRKAIVGSGMSHIGFALSGGRVAAPLPLFNGGTEDGVTTLLVHSAVPAPEPVPTVSVIKISPVASRDNKDVGLQTVWRLPRIIDGTGSLLDFRFTIKRYLSVGGARHGYIEAQCPNDSLLVNLKKILFRNEAKTPGVAAQTVMKGGLAIPCTPSR
jgi:hypothetical protein